MLTQLLIERKRDGGRLSAAEIDKLITGYTDGSIPDYQMAAFAMAVYFQGMDDHEIADLTASMMNSGEVLDFTNWPLPTVDKHSTGGIGDKLSLILAPLAASVGMAVPKLSGRGLGITGGTLDKLESIPGMNVRLDNERFKKVVREVGCAINGQTADLAPADRKLYSLRDVTGTVPSPALIASSIMSKKLAAGASAMVLDVKCGRGAFMTTVSAARQLAEIMTGIGRRLGREVTAVISDMNRPLGTTVGNGLEVIEAVEVLRGDSRAEVRSLAMELATEMALVSGLYTERANAKRAVTDKLDDGSAYEVFLRMVAAQDGDVGVIEDLDKLPRAPVVKDALAPTSGYVHDIDAAKLGLIVLGLGAGRRLPEDDIDHSTGISHLCHLGMKVDKGQSLARIHAVSDHDSQRSLQRLLEAVVISEEPLSPPPQLLDTVR